MRIAVVINTIIFICLLNDVEKLVFTSNFISLSLGYIVSYMLNSEIRKY